MEAIKRGKIFARPRMELGEAAPLAAPLSLEIDVSGLCNLQCKFCFRNDSVSKETATPSYSFMKTVMDFELYQKIINDVKESGWLLKKLKLSCFGEPLLNPRLADMIRLAKSSGITEYIELTTNGIAFTEEMCRNLVEAGLDRVNISINGLTSEDYQKNCLRAVDVAALREKIAYLYSIRNNCWIYVKLGDIGFSAEEKQTFYKMFSNLCDEIFIENILDDAFKDAHAEGKKTTSKKTGAYDQDMIYKAVCPFLFSRMIVNTEGIVCACCMDWKAEHSLGDLKKDPIADIWNGAVLKNLQKMHLLGKRESIHICRGCAAPSAFTIDNMDKYADEVLERLSWRNSEHGKYSI